MRRRWQLASSLAVSAALLPGGAAHAQLGASAPGDSRGDGLVTVSLLCGSNPIGPGQTFHLGVRFDIMPKWHMYWKNPGAGALPPRIVVTAPAGYTVGDVLWPRPVAITTPLGPEYGYYDAVVLFVPITAPATLTDGTVSLHAFIQWTVCREVCRMGSARREVVTATSSRAGATAPTVGPGGPLAALWKRLPAALSGLTAAGSSFDGTTLSLTGPAGGMTSAAFFPVDAPGITYGTADITIRQSRFRVTVPVELKPANAAGEPMALAGLVTLGEKPDDPCYDFMIPLTVEPPDPPDPTRKADAPRD